ncbi:MAG TPA: xylulokinase [Acidimicrobiales bacterium]|nr:xylulokinase [Acidimicrobiales bacterium]
MPLVMGVDSSTQSTKVEVRDADNGRLVAHGHARHPATGHPPRSEQDPKAWWDALVIAVGQTGERDIAALSVAAQQHGLVVLDAAGAVLRPAKLWNDTESAPEAAAMVQQFGAERWAKACGTVPVASLTVTKLAWLARHEQHVLDRVGHVLLPHDYLTYRLTGRYVTDRGDASGTGYWSPVEGRWRVDLLERVVGAPASGAWIDRVPEVLEPSEASDWMTASVHEVLGLRGRPLCGPGTGDNMAAALGVALAPSDVAISLGTSGTVYTVSPSPSADRSGAVAGFADATGQFLPLVCTLNATLVTDAFGRMLGADTVELDALALGASPGAGGLVVLPYLNGERTPNRPGATGTVTGLTGDAGRAELARAAYEGVVCGLLDGLDALERAVPGLDRRNGRTVLVGGGARSPAYRQIVADLSGRPITVPAGEEHVAMGACVQAAAVLHQRPPAEIAAAWGLGEGEIVEPDVRVDPAMLRSRYAAVRDAVR